MTRRLQFLSVLGCLACLGCASVLCAETYEERRDREREASMRQPTDPVGPNGWQGAGPASYGPNGIDRLQRDAGRGLQGPVAPVTNSRPASWPGGPGDTGTSAQPPHNVIPQMAAGGPPRPTRNGLHPILAALPPMLAPNGTPIEASTIVARVGSEVVQGVDVMPQVDEMLVKNVMKAMAAGAPDAPLPTPEQLAPVRAAWFKASLAEAVKVKLLYGEAKHNVPAENLPKFEEQIIKAFNTDQLPKLMADQKVSDRTELELKFRSYGTSLEAKKRQFVETNLGYSWLFQQVKLEPEVTHEEMSKYYTGHGEVYENLAKARWEHLSVRFDKHPSKEEMKRLICDWGNQVLSGVPLAEVAKAHSEDSSASDGGINDWTSKGNLASPVIDDAIFSLPVGRLSQVLEDNNGLHIIRVVERKEAFKTPFLECQDEIKKKIKNNKTETQRKEHLAKLEAKIPVQTIFDASVPTQSVVSGSQRSDAPTPHTAQPPGGYRR